jgi:hypothetical protein
MGRLKGSINGFSEAQPGTNSRSKSDMLEIQFSVVFDIAQFAELVHEKAHA